jgi:hypothetical protein
MMRHLRWTFCLVCIPLISFSQIVINNFDGAVSEGTANWTLIERAPSTIEIRDDSTDAHEGAAALRASVFIGALNQWGSFAQVGYQVPEGEPPMDWTGSDSLSVWIKVHTPPNLPENVVLRAHLVDQPGPDANKEEYIYENTTVIDFSNGWVELVIPLVERHTDGSVLPNDEGFVLFPKSWGSGTYNNEVLELDQLVRYSFVLVTTGWNASGPLPEETIDVSFDAFARSGNGTKVQETAASNHRFLLSANYPNPFNPSTDISFQIPETGRVRLSVFNLTGQKVATLADEVMSVGVHHARFEAGDLPSGVYFYRLETGSQLSTRKMILLP